MRTFALIVTCLALTSCATQGPGSSVPGQQDAMLKASPECLAANLRPAEPMPVGLLPDELLRRAQSGWVAVRYDIVAGRARNPVVVASQPPGLYDEYVLRHASEYSEPTRATVRGCIMTTHIRF
jgi:hypothetical protein